MSKRFLIADTHFGDENILRYENRPFATVEEMNDAIVKNWNSVVGEDDTVFVVGDFFSGNPLPYFSLINSLKGHIKLILGNHDIEYLDIYKNIAKIEIIEYPIILDGFWMISHEPMYVSMNMPYANIFAHVHNNPMYKTVSPRSYCVSVERIGYTPIDFEEVKKKVSGCNG